MITKVVTQPLGLSHTGVNITQDIMEESTGNLRKHYLAEPYLENFTSCGLACLRDFGWSYPSGSMYSSINDLAKICSLMFQYDKPSSNILSPTTLRETLLPKYLMPDREGGYALTWELYRIGDYMIRTKRGDVKGYASELIMVPELKLGIVVLANQVEHAQYAAQRSILL